jgi:hypothetical protein
VQQTCFHSVLAVLDVQKHLKVLRRSLPHGSNLGNSQKVHGIEFPKVLFWPTPLAGGLAVLINMSKLRQYDFH